mmetsp:Transcript_60874/g.166862  ORF Transcript_60874/g.166862 Transcript_60874/m.166862 type:complete len:216 (-) Transcript_60874:682-1329(-)
MPEVFSDWAVLREMACSSETIFSCELSILLSSSAFFSSKVSISSDISLSFAKSSWYFWALGSFASLISLESCESCARPRRMASWCSATRRSASEISELSALTFCSSISRCCDSDSCGPSSSSASSCCLRSSRMSSSRSRAALERIGSRVSAASISWIRSSKKLTSACRLGSSWVARIWCLVCSLRKCSFIAGSISSSFCAIAWWWRASWCSTSRA